LKLFSPVAELSRIGKSVPRSKTPPSPTPAPPTLKSSGPVIAARSEITTTSNKFGGQGLGGESPPFSYEEDGMSEDDNGIDAVTSIQSKDAAAANEVAYVDVDVADDGNKPTRTDLINKGKIDIDAMETIGSGKTKVSAVSSETSPISEQSQNAKPKTSMVGGMVGGKKKSLPPKLKSHHSNITVPAAKHNEITSLSDQIGESQNGPDEIGAVPEGLSPMSLQHRVLSSVIEETLAEFRLEMKEEIQNMHLELLRQFQIQKVFAFAYVFIKQLNLILKLE
jgi:regulator of extracellular matrix RemA (YlzA/DUF370 family)